MTQQNSFRWMLLVGANVAVWCMLSLQQTIGANPRATGVEGITATQQRAEIIAQLREIKAEVKQLVMFRQNGSLPSPDPIQP